MIMHCKKSDHHQTILKLEYDLLFHVYTTQSVALTFIKQQSVQQFTLLSSSEIEATSALHGNNSSNTSTDASATSDRQQDDLEGAVAELQQEWQDATNDTNRGEVHSCCFYSISYSPRRGHHL